MTPIRDEFDRWLEDEAAGLRKHWDSPELWPRIAGSLESERKQQAGPAPVRLWLMAAAAMLAILLLPAILIWRSQPRDPALLSDDAFAEVRQAERAYAQSIERMAKLAAPRLQNPPSPLIASYRERLLLLDEAIAALRIETEHNPYNDHLQRELLALYQDKQKTLQGILSDEKQTAKP